MQATRSNPTTLKAVSYLLGIALIAFVLVAGVGFRETTIGRLALAGLIGLGVGLLILFRPQFGGFILIAMIITNISSLATVQELPSINKPLVVLVAVSVLLSYLLSKSRRLPKLGQIEWLMLLLLGVWVASLLVAENKSPAQDKIIEMIKNFVILVSIIYSLHAPKYWKQAIWITIIVTTILAALGSYQVITGNYVREFGGLAGTSRQEILDGVFQYRLSGPISAPNYWAQFLVAVLPLSIYRILDEKRLWIKIFAAVSALILVYAALSTYSRGGFLALIAVLILITLERRARPSLVIVVLAATLLILALLPANYSERIQSLLTLTRSDNLNTLYQESSFRGRLAEARAGLRMFGENPILGVGAGNYQFLYQEHARKLNIETRTGSREAHSLYIETLAETGLVGLAAFSLLFGSLLWGLFQVRKRMESQDQYKRWITWIAAIQMSITAYLISSIFLHGNYIRYLWILVALGSAGLYLSRRILEDPELIDQDEVVII